MDAAERVTGPDTVFLAPFSCLGVACASVEERRGNHVAPPGLGAVVPVAVHGVVVAGAVGEVPHGVHGNELIEGNVHLHRGADPAAGQSQHFVGDDPFFVLDGTLLFHGSSGSSY